MNGAIARIAAANARRASDSVPAKSLTPTRSRKSSRISARPSAASRASEGLLALAAHGRQHHGEEEVHLRETEAESADGRNHVEVGELHGVVGVAAGHAGQTQEVHPGKKVMLNEIIDHQKWILPRVSLYITPVHLGSQ